MHTVYLVHHGVKGMRWGINKRERARALRGTKSEVRVVKKGESNVKVKVKGPSKPEASKNPEMDHPSKRLKPQELEWDDLKKRVERLDMEKKYSDHMARLHPKKHARLKKFLGNQLESLGKMLLDAAAKKLVGAIFDDKSKKKGDTKDNDKKDKPGKDKPGKDKPEPKLNLPVPYYRG